MVHQRLRGAFVTLVMVTMLGATYMPLTFAQTRSTTSTAVPTSSQTPEPIPIPSHIPPPQPIVLPPGTRELIDSQVVADRVAQGQLQTYHFSISQRLQHVPVRRQLERIIFHPGVAALELQRRQDPIGTPSPSPSPHPTSTSTSSAVPAPTRTIAPTLPSPLADGKYAVFISISTCSTPKSGNGICPPLVMYVSTSTSQPLPGPGQDPKVVQMVEGQEGLIQYTAYTSNDIFFSLHAPTLQGTWTGDWAVEVGASSQGYVQGYQSSQGLILDDTDSTSASFLTHNFTAVPTFKVFLVESNALPVGLTHSLCAIEVIQPIPLTKANMVVTQTNRTSNLDGSLGRDILPHELKFEQFGQRRQVLVQSLTPGREYTAFFITDVLNQIEAEVMYGMTSFRTKRRDNCVLITDLQFCQEAAYAVPITPLATLPGGGAANTTIRQDVKNHYDGFAESLMDNFDKVLGQYDCTRSQYSLIRNCTHCRRAYRRWLCSVSIPRCTDVEDVRDFRNKGNSQSDTVEPNAAANPYLIDRTQGPVIVERSTNTSRGAIAPSAENPLMNPGVYGEVLPCIDLCFDVVQSCPNFLEFSCPVKNMAGNYAHMNPDGFQCNGLGVVPVPSGSTSMMMMMKSSRHVLFAVVVAMALL
ncbi:stretch-activated cation channel mid1 [Haplosporangium sp. Z 767]|nr:stretch-activated cation channel mid1 [Haplosporangium sp. Z 767]KAF9188043.1 stretch-activated cation channel mid1 [Haplosporangium sp. Z 11]